MKSLALTLLLVSSAATANEGTLTDSLNATKEAWAICAALNVVVYSQTKDFVIERVAERYVEMLAAMVGQTRAEMLITAQSRDFAKRYASGDLPWTEITDAAYSCSISLVEAGMIE